MRAGIDLVTGPLFRVRVDARDERRQPGERHFPSAFVGCVPRALILVLAEVEILSGHLARHPRTSQLHPQIDSRTDGRGRVLLGVETLVEHVVVDPEARQRDRRREPERSKPESSCLSGVGNILSRRAVLRDATHDKAHEHDSTDAHD